MLNVTFPACSVAVLAKSSVYSLLWPQLYDTELRKLALLGAARLLKALSVCLRARWQARHHRVKRWLDQEDVHLMSGRGYRARALAELANFSTFNYRGHVHDLRRASAEASLLSDDEPGPGQTSPDGAPFHHAQAMLCQAAPLMSSRYCRLLCVRVLHQEMNAVRLALPGRLLRAIE